MENTHQPELTIYCRVCGAILQKLSDIRQEDKSPCHNCGSAERFYVRVGAAVRNGEASKHTKKMIEKKT